MEAVDPPDLARRLRVSKRTETALIVTRNLPPLVGGMERLVWHVVDALTKEYQVHVIGPAGCAPLLPAGVTASEIPITPLWWFLARAKWSALLQALRLRPKLIFAGSGLTAPFAWLAARLTGAKCVVYLHGLDIEATSLPYRLLWRPFFKHFDQVLVNSRFTQRLAVAAGVSANRINILHPGVELPDQSSRDDLRRSFRARHQLNEAPVLLYAGRIIERKGLLAFAQHILPKIISSSPSLRLVVIGDEPKWALRQERSQSALIQKTLDDQGCAKNVLFLGSTSDEELNAAYFSADVLIFPVQHNPGDSEGFGMVAIEAAAHGLPTVAFDAGGVGDAVADKISGRLLPAGDNQAFAQALLDLLEKPLTPEAAQLFAAEFAWPIFEQQLLQHCTFDQDGSA